MNALIVLLSIICLLVYFALKWKHSYWTRRGVLHREPKFLFGHFRDVFIGNKIFSDVIRDAYYQFKRAGASHGGVYFVYTPIWIPVDLKLIKQILNKDLLYFTGHGKFIYSHKDDILTKHLFNAEGQEWKSLRSKLTPTFSSGKIKLMYNILDTLGDRLEKKVTFLCQQGEPLNIKEVAACFGTDVIASCAFGIECNTLENPNNDFRTYGKKVFEPNIFWELLEMMVNWEMLSFFGYTWKGKEVNNFFINLVRDMVNYRKKNDINRPDFLNLLLELNRNQNASLKDSLTFEDIAANVFMMYIAGFETTATTTSFLMYELARNPEVQDKVRTEICQICAKHPDGRMTYDDLQDMKYIEKVIQETLRRHSVGPEVPRHCTTDYKVPESDVVIQKGTLVLMPAWAIHNDPEYFPNPEEFNPENFSEENKASRADSTFLAFGDGPRQCIGMRFAHVQIKLALVKYLKNYKYSLNPKTPKDISHEANAVTIVPKGEVLLDISEIKS